ncbi:SWEET sugar transporter [Cynara cardunculus var. scolymus]|uniref:SWEET sugar transporter n=1 Tax=Cynara cardunculus var. scolymus TaxID=59895 RepID=A0A103YC31_CYNCS|nr:SWEET sugar transporter [Cynara cardunculus var. scolymus]
MKIIKAKSVQAFKPDPYVATILNCAMWAFYGLPIVHPDSLLVITINGAGFAIECVYVTIFFIYSSWGGRKKIIIVLIIEAIFVAVIVVVTLTFFHTYASRSMIVGLICIVFNILMYASPLTVMVPNALGTISAIIQLVLYATYYSTTNWDEDEPSEVQMSASTNA